MLLTSAALLVHALPPVALQESAGHPREYWAQIVESGYTLPEGESAYELILELSDHLGSRDSELRDDFGYGIPAAWIYSQGLLEPEQLLALTESWSANLERGLERDSEEREGDAVLLRSFSALNLSLLAAHDNRTPFLDDEAFEALLNDALTYLAEERDLRGWGEQAGWYHATAHTADLLKFLGRSRHLTPAGQRRILDAIAERMLATDGYVFVHGEDDRLASAIASILVREDFEPVGMQAFVEHLVTGTRLPPDAEGFDPVHFAAQQNVRNLLRALFIKFSLAGELSPELEQARDQVLQALRTL